MSDGFYGKLAARNGIQRDEAMKLLDELMQADLMNDRQRWLRTWAKVPPLLKKWRAVVQQSAGAEPVKQFHSSNPYGTCDYCGKHIEWHKTGNYFCPSEQPSVGAEPKP